jgi:hypothetical protein
VLPGCTSCTIGRPPAICTSDSTNWRATVGAGAVDAVCTGRGAMNFAGSTTEPDSGPGKSEAGATSTHVVGEVVGESPR